MKIFNFARREGYKIICKNWKNTGKDYELYDGFKLNEIKNRNRRLAIKMEPEEYGQKKSLKSLR